VFGVEVLEKIPVIAGVGGKIVEVFSHQLGQSADRRTQITATL